MTNTDNRLTEANIISALRALRDGNHDNGVLQMLGECLLLTVAADLLESQTAEIDDKTDLLGAAIAGRETLQRALAEADKDHQAMYERAEAAENMNSWNASRADELQATLARVTAERDAIGRMVNKYAECAEQARSDYNRVEAHCERLAAQLTESQRQTRAAVEALRLAIANHSTDPRQIERLVKYYLAEASGPQGAGENNNGA